MSAAGEALIIDLRGVPMPDHMQRAAAAIDQVAEDSRVVLLTDQEVVLKYVPAEAAIRGLRSRAGPDGEGAWRITLTRPEQSGAPAGDEQ